MLGDGLTGEVVPAVHEIPSKLVEKAAASGSKELPSFLVALWAIVMRQYIESESVCFGLHTSTSSSAGPVRACCQVSMSQETTVKGLWGNHEGRRIFAPDEEEPAYNTAVLLSDSTAKSGDPAGLLKELEGKSRVSLPRASLAVHVLTVTGKRTSPSPYS